MEITSKVSNGIRKRQNEENSILKLAAQRQIYNEAKKIEYLIVIFSVVIPFVFACIQIFIKNNAILNSWSYIFSFFSMIVALIFSAHIDKKKGNAAFIQQQFDIYVYQMPWDKKLFGKNRNVNDVIADKSRKHLENAANKEKLMDWYPPIVDTVQINKGILSCQKENYKWDVDLRKRFRIASIIVVVILITIIIMFGIISDETISDMICRLAFIFPLAVWLFETIKKLNHDISRLSELYDFLSDKKDKDLDELQCIQKLIYEHRKACMFIPNFFYQFFYKKDEQTAKNMVQIDSRE